MEDKKNLAETFLDAYQLMQNYHLTWYRRNFGGIDPFQGQGRILTALRRRHNVNQKDLGVMLELRPQSLGELLQKLEANGYIRRYRSPTDKRALVVELTEKGEYFQTQKPDYDELFADFSAREQVQFQKALQKVVARLEEQIEKQEAEEYDWVYNW